jgi:small subunit ribosomal protein S18
MSYFHRYKTYPTVSGDSSKEVDYKDLDAIKMYIMESGRIIPARVTGVTPKQQRRIVKNIKIARFLALIPYTDRH